MKENRSGIQKTESRRQNENKSLEESRYYLILANDLEYMDVSEPTRLIEEASKLLDAYMRAILDSDS